MARSQGYNTQVLLKRESSYGTDPNGNFYKLPFNSCDLGKRIGLTESPRAGMGRSMKEHYQDAPVVAGRVSVPACPRTLGFWLTGLLGDPNTSGSGTYTHVFTSEATSLPSYAIEVGHPDVPAYYLNLGCAIGGMTLEMPKAGPVSFMFDILGQSEAKNTSTEGGTPVNWTTSTFFSPMSGLVGTVKKGGSALGNLNPGARLSYQNNLNPVDILNQTAAQIGGIDPGPIAISGDLNMRFASTTELDAATAGTPVDLNFVLALSGSLSLDIAVHEAYLERTAPAIEGPGGIDAAFAFKGNYNTSNSKALTATLINNQAGSVYTS